MTFARVLIVATSLSAAFPAPLIAGETIPAETRSIAKAVARGQLLHAYDQAAWHGTDAMLVEARTRGLTEKLSTMLGGWIVSGTADEPVVIFFDTNESDPHAVFIARLSDGGRTLRSSHFLDPGEDAAIDSGTKALIRARRIASASIAEATLQRCSKGNFNMAVLPPDEPGAPTAVYFLSSQDALDKVPFGGNFRVEVAANGTAGAVHAFTRTCLDLPTSQATEKPAALFVTQLLDPVPTEISVFAVLVAQLPLFVMTSPNGKTWVVEAVGGRAAIRLAPDRQGR